MLILVSYLSPRIFSLCLPQLQSPSIMATLYSEERESQERLISGSDEENFTEDTKCLRERQPRWSRYQINGLFVLSLWTLILLFASVYLWATATRRSQALIYKCNDYIPIYSPALISQVGTGHIEQFDGSFAKQNRYKGPASPAIDEGWDDITFADGKINFTLARYLK